MCGIFGVIHKNQNNKVDIKKSLDSIKHRGPDDVGFYEGENVSFGFRRLSIIDLSVAGNQPITNEDSSIYLVCNGEIYNFQELKKELSSKHKFKSNTDIEVLLHGYEEWGIDGVLKKVNGMFAFALYDSVKNLTYLVRDRIGKKPLYYCSNNNYVAFSSETKAFFKLEDFSFGIDKNMFSLFMGFPYLPDNNATIIKNVFKIPPASYMEIKNGEILKEITYWEIVQTDQNQNINLERSTDQIEELLVDSVKKRLIADVPVGVLLSGGIDSSLITSIASRYSDNTIKTINISFKNSLIDESKYARIVADYCKTDHVELRLDINDIYDSFKDNIWIYDDLSTVDGGLFSEFLLSKEIRKKGIKVILVGEGADEIFGGYSWFQFSQYPLSLFPDIIKSCGYYYAIMRELPGKNFFKYAFLLNKKLNEIDNDYFKKIQRYEIYYSLPNHYCMKLDKGTSAASIEARAPYMDYRIIDLAFQLDNSNFLGVNYYSKKSYEKYILRQISRKYLPPEIVSRKKKGGMLPVNDILDIGIARDRELIVNNEYLNVFFGESYLDRLIESRPVSKFLVWQKEWILWKCLVFSLWLDYFKKYGEN